MCKAFRISRCVLESDEAAVRVAHKREAVEPEMHTQGLNVLGQLRDGDRPQGDAL